jgi:RimJ/RimL family protein N-acetyltransferase
MTSSQLDGEVKFPERPNTAVFVERFDEVKNLYARAFAGYPWFENLDDEEVTTRLQEQVKRPGFSAFLATLMSDELAGGLWYSTPTVESLSEERGEALGAFVASNATSSAAKLVYTHETVVDPGLQGKGIATGLRSSLISSLESTYPDGVCVITRMRDDNSGILTVSKKFGYERTGIRMPSRSTPDISHEYWYRLINYGE